MFLMKQTPYTTSKSMDILNGTQIQRIGPGGGLVSIAAVSNTDCDLEIFIGDRQVIEKADPNTKQLANPATNAPVVGPDHPEIPYDMIIEDEPAEPGAYIQMNVVGTANGTLFYRINVEPIR